MLPRVYKLVYIYLNSRVLKRTNKQPIADEFMAFIEYLEGMEAQEFAADSDEGEP